MRLIAEVPQADVHLFMRQIYLRGTGDELMAVTPGGGLSRLFTNDDTYFQIEWSSTVYTAPWDIGYPTTYLAGDFVADNDNKDELLYLKAGGTTAGMWHYVP